MAYHTTVVYGGGIYHVGGQDMRQDLEDLEDLESRVLYNR